MGKPYPMELRTRVVAYVDDGNEIIGDASYMFSQAGNDTLFASHSGNNVRYGDAYRMHGFSVGGNDRLVSGLGDDAMWGNAKFRSGIALDEADEDEWFESPPGEDNIVGGSDVFVFRPCNGNDTIHDFEPGKDVIELRNFGRTWNPWEFDDLTIAKTADGRVINLLGQNSIAVLEVEELTSDDVRFRSDLS